MRPATGTGPAAIVLFICAGLLAACSGATLPFSKMSDAPSARTPPPIFVSTITGLPDAQVTALFDALAGAAAERDIPIGSGKVEHGYALAGEFEALETGAGTTLRYRWTLTDNLGRQLHRIEETEAAELAGETSAGSGNTFRRIAAYTAENLSSRLSQLGYATRAAGLPPPLDHMVQAGPDAEREIDYETLHGPYMTAGSDRAGPQPPLPEHVAAVSEPPSEHDPDPQAGRAGPSIRGVAITGVTGAGRTGNGELANALARVLSDAGWPIEKGLRGDTLSIQGDVTIGQPNGKAQKVALRWTVKAPDGDVLGIVEQANEVPAGSLDDAWGKAADYAALAAAEGIFNLVDQLR